MLKSASGNLGSNIVENALANREALTRAKDEPIGIIQLKITSDIKSLAFWLTFLIRSKDPQAFVLEDRSDSVSRWVAQSLATRVFAFKHCQALRLTQDKQVGNPVYFLFKMFEDIFIHQAQPVCKKPIVRPVMIDPVLEGAVYGYDALSKIDPEKALAGEMVLLLAIKEWLTNVEFDHKAELRLLQILAESLAKSNYYCSEQEPLLQEIISHEPIRARLQKLLVSRLEAATDDDTTIDCRRYIKLLGLICSREFFKEQATRIDDLNEYQISEQTHLIPLSMMYIAKNMKANLSRQEQFNFYKLAEQQLVRFKAREESQDHFDGDLERLIASLDELVIQLKKDLRIVN